MAGENKRTPKVGDVYRLRNEVNMYMITYAGDASSTRGPHPAYTYVWLALGKNRKIPSPIFTSGSKTWTNIDDIVSVDAEFMFNLGSEFWRSILHTIDTDGEKS